MMAILTLFLMSKFGIDGEQAGKIYSFFYTSIYILALVGGLIADRLRNYKGTIIAGILVMTAGVCRADGSHRYVEDRGDRRTDADRLRQRSVQRQPPGARGAALRQRTVCQTARHGLSDFLHVHQHRRDVRTVPPPWACATGGSRTQDSSTTPTFGPLPPVYRRHDESRSGPGPFQRAGCRSEPSAASRRTWAFSRRAISTPSTPDSTMRSAWLSWRWSSRWWFSWPTRRNCPIPKVAAASRTTPSKAEIQQDAREIKQRLYALFAVFAIVIFFWFSFHQNGLTLTLFAQDYTRLEIFGMPITAGDFPVGQPLLRGVPHAGHHRRSSPGCATAARSLRLR